MAKIDHDAILKRLKAQIRERFPINCRVRMTSRAAKQWPKYAKTEGTVVRYGHGIAPSVLWDGRKTDSSYHPDFLRRVHS